MKIDYATRKRYRILSKKIEKKTSIFSSTKQMLDEPLMTDLTNLGKAGMTLILEELARIPLGHWSFAAIAKIAADQELRAPHITTKNRGYYGSIRRAYVDWGIKNGLTKKTNRIR